MKPVEFAIFTLTYNRPALVAHTLESLRRQTYQSFNVLLLDNGSNPPLDLSTLPALPNLEFRRLDTNQHPSDVAEQNWENIPGDYFVWLHDDDALAPNALATVAEFIKANPGAEFVFANCAHFDHQAGRPTADTPFFSGRVIEFDGPHLARGHCSVWGLNLHGSNPPYTHNSATFISRSLLRRTRQQQERIFIKPFGDVGFYGAVGLASRVYYLDLPLGVIGHTAVRELRGSTRNGRRHFLPEIPSIVYSPLRGATFINLVAESHLKVAEALGFFCYGQPRFKLDFFLSHLAHILTDDPYDHLTLLDAVETIDVARDMLRDFVPHTVKARRRYIKLNCALRLIELAGEGAVEGAALTLRQRWLLKVAGRFVAAGRLKGFSRKANGATAPRFENIVEYAASLPRRRPVAIKPQLPGQPQVQLILDRPLHDSEQSENQLLMALRGRPVTRLVRTLYQVGAHRFRQKQLLFEMFPNLRNVILFEPLEEFYTLLREQEKDDPRITVLPYAVSDTDGESIFHVASNDGASSSILPFARHSQLFPEVNICRKTLVQTRTLATAIRKHELPPPDCLFLDVQGAEYDILATLTPELRRLIRMIYTEASLEEVYAGAHSLAEVEKLLESDFSFSGFCPLRETVTSYGNALFVQKSHLWLLLPEGPASFQPQGNGVADQLWARILRSMFSRKWRHSVRKRCATLQQALAG